MFSIDQITARIVSLDQVIDKLVGLSFNQIIGYILSPGIQAKLFWIKLIFIIVSILFFLFIIYFIKKTPYVDELFLTDASEFSSYKAQGTKKMVKQWNKILARLKIDSQSGWKLSIAEADNLLDSILQRIGTPGSNKEERVNNLEPEIVPHLEALKEARSISENIIQDPNYSIEKKKAEEILEIYDKVLKDLKAF